MSSVGSTSGQRDRWHEENILVGEVSDKVDDGLWNGGLVRVRPYGFDSEDPTLCGHTEDGSDGAGVVLVRASDQARFLVDVQVFVQQLKPLAEDPDYIAAQRALGEEAGEAEPVNSNQLSIYDA